MMVSGSVALPLLRAETSAKASFEALNQPGQEDFSALLFLVLSLPRSPENSAESAPEQVGAQEFGAILTPPMHELAIGPMSSGLQLNSPESSNLDDENQALSVLAVGAPPVLVIVNTLSEDAALQKAPAEESPAARAVYEIGSILTDGSVQSKDVVIDAGSKHAHGNLAESLLGPDRKAAPEAVSTALIGEEVASWQFNGGPTQEGQANSTGRVTALGEESSSNLSSQTVDALRNESSSNENKLLRVVANESPDVATSSSEDFSEARLQATLIAKRGYAAQAKVARVGESITNGENLSASGDNIPVNNAFVADRPLSRTAATWPESSIHSRSFAPLKLADEKSALLTASDPSTGEVSAVKFVSSSDRFSHAATESSFAASDNQQTQAFDAREIAGERDLLPGGRKSAPVNPEPAVFFSPSAPQRVDGISADIRSNANWHPVVERVAGEIVARIRFDKREAVIQLDPPELGKLKIDLQLDGDKLHAHVRAEGQDARNLIEHHVHELRQSLQAQQLDLVEIRIDQGDWANSRGDSPNGQRQGANGEREWQSGFSAPAVEPNEKNIRWKLPETGRVSMWA